MMRERIAKTRMHDVARPPRPCRKGEGALATSCLATTFCIKELYQKGAKVIRGNGLGQGENDIISSLDMSGEMHMRRRSEVFGCIPHGRGALS